MVGVVVVTEVAEVVVHVLGGVNLEVFSLSVCDFKLVDFSELLVFTEISTEERAVVISVVELESSSDEGGNSEEGDDSPTDCHPLELRDS